METHAKCVPYLMYIPTMSYTANVTGNDVHKATCIPNTQLLKTAISCNVIIACLNTQPFFPTILVLTYWFARNNVDKNGDV